MTAHTCGASNNPVRSSASRITEQLSENMTTRSDFSKTAFAAEAKASSQKEAIAALSLNMALACAANRSNGTHTKKESNGSDGMEAETARRHEHISTNVLQSWSDIIHSDRWLPMSLLPATAA
eukprot:516809-Pleurochrysis_carterae.AAC.2